MSFDEPNSGFNSVSSPISTISVRFSDFLLVISIEDVSSIPTFVFSKFVFIKNTLPIDMAIIVTTTISIFGEKLKLRLDFCCTLCSWYAD